MNRQEAIEYIQEWLKDEYALNGKDRVVLNTAIEALKQERPRGEWIRISNDWIDGTCGARYFPIRCSVCDYSTYDNNATNFCPDCGADMRGDKE